MVSIHTPGLNPIIQRADTLELTWNGPRLERISFRGPTANGLNVADGHGAEQLVLEPPRELQGALAADVLWLIDALLLARLKPLGRLYGQPASVAISCAAPHPEDPTAPGNALAIDTKNRTMTIWRSGRGNLPWTPTGDSAFLLQGLAANARPEQTEAYAFWLLRALFRNFEIAERTAAKGSAYVNLRIV
jgi:hypothetical protein